MGKRRAISRRMFLSATALGAASVVLAACQPAPAPTAAPAPTQQPAQEEPAAAAEPTTVPATLAPESKEFTFWFPPQADWGEFIRDKFNEAGTGITATLEVGEYDSNQKIISALAAGAPPDCSYQGRWVTADLAVRSALVQLDDYVASAKNFSWENIWQRLQKDSINWGKKFCIPYTTDTRVLFYNKDAMADAGLDPEAPPKTWDDLHAMAVKITKKGDEGKLERIGFTPSFGNPPGFLMFLSVLWCLGSDMVNADMTRITIEEKGEEALTMIQTLMDDQGGYEETNSFMSGLSLGQGLDAFTAGKVGLALNGAWVIPGYDQYAKDVNYGMAPGPVVGSGTVPFNYDGGGAWYFFKKGQNFDAAWKFVDHIMGLDFQTQYADHTNGIPSRSDAGEKWAQLDEKRRRAFVATAETVQWIPVFVGVMESLSFLATMFDNVMIGKKDIKAELKVAAEGMQQILDRHASFPVPS